ncbi:RagB/SusD family nutrient uptake outer membrane protein [Natronoflexus pectinivorans]|uniref:Putative outer membrane starch-binding protein n=1 Tax=Natronoflexus pectinivorans TaxID=682526 RepID=A0A4R2GIU2_9BACT|nr:RagB/SusD family nutrient uptake outer membrane protein [Natronoflexus pectinivorans]TCO08438.1 putative outer membrane starch-binding protein [Natronoflexus pectinivorans]
MKKIKYLFFIAALGIGWGCSDFLEIDPINTQSEANFFNVPENAILAVNGCYGLLGMTEGPGPDGNWQAHNYEFFFGDILSDDAEKGSNESDFPDITDMKIWDAKPDNGVIDALWIKIYDGISRCNTALERLAESTLEDRLRKRLMGEVYFIRGYWYFYGSRVFGGLPIFTEPVRPSQFGNVERASLHETYLQAEKDFKAAIERLPERSGYAPEDLGRATKGAARHYLARLYMYMIGTDIDNTSITWQSVYDVTSAIISSGEYRLADNYALIWEPMGENSAESVFELQMLEGSHNNKPRKTGSNFNQFQANRLDWGWGFNNPTLDLFNSFEEDDPRLSVTLYGPTFNNGIMGGQQWDYDLTEQMTPFLNRKAALMPGERPNITKSSSYNIRLARYAEVLLNHAEAAYHTGNETEARDMINMVRERARNSTFARGFDEGSLDFPVTGFSGNLPDVTASGEALLEAIYQERRTELGMEAIRYFDLVRTGRYLETLDKIRQTFTPAHDESILRYANIDLRSNALERSIPGPNGNRVFLLPIPLREVADWGLRQNPGY